ncbi:hypothetical protein HYV80_05330 [Candidatus Woesearchaeota archaeon]|nr:hypothetical protein [Candidatus Woesearchaeota archaeon]
MTIDRKELSKLSHEERIKKLRHMEEEHKKEVHEIEHLIKESMQSIKTDRIAEEIAPGQKAVDISKLFEAKGEENLESAAREARTSSKGTGNYQVVAQTYHDYSQLKEFYGIVSMGSSLTEDQKAAIGQIGERINVAEKYMTSGEKTAEILDASRATLRKLKKETGLG